MPGFASKSQINKLGERLAKNAVPEEADLVLLQKLRAAYDEPMRAVERTLRGLGLQATSRLKTVNTIVDKLKRERTRLSTMQDIAGLRIVKDMTLTEQGEIAGRVVAAFGEAKLVDRRERPSFGYRALHVIVTLDDCLIEVQLRTELQDLWAQLMEKFGDKIGRGIRYGAIPEDPYAAKLLTAHMDVSKRIREVEKVSIVVDETAQELARTPSNSSEYPGMLATYKLIKSTLDGKRIVLMELLKKQLEVLGQGE